MIDREHGVRLSAAESGLKLHHRLSAQARQRLRDLGQQQAHTFGDEGTLEEGDGILIFAGRLASIDRRDVGGELGLLEGTFQNIPMGYRDFSPRLHGHPAAR